MIALGSTEISKMYLGADEVDKIYLGSELVYSKEPQVLPYDAEVEYLRGTGNGQYIDTGISYNSTIVVDAKLKLMSNSAGGYMFGIYTTVNGIAQRWGVNPASSNNVTLHFGTSTSTQTSFIRNVWHIIHADYRYLNVDGIIADSKASAFTPTSDVRLFIFSRSNDNSPVTYREMNIEYFKITKDNVLVRDYIPVRVGTTGYLYDKVSRQLFANAGTGSFVFGNDVI